MGYTHNYGYCLGKENADFGMNIADFEKLRLQANKFANKIATGPNLIYSSIKEVMRKTENIDEQPAFDILRSLDSVKKVYNSEDLSEGASSFVKKEKPKWKGK